MASTIPRVPGGARNLNLKLRKGALLAGAKAAAMDPSILLDRDGAVATITLNRPAVLNALNGELLARLDEALATVDGLIAKYTDGRGLGFSGEQGVNVLELNLALDRLTGAK